MRAAPKIAALGLALAAAPAGATELRLVIPEAAGLTEAVRAASLTIAEVAEGETSRRDIASAAQADYRRIVGVLFEAGHYGPVVSIEVDGVEAAELPVVGPGGDVSDVTITVLPGPRFLFSSARIGPLARGTELPEDFRPGAVAEAATLRNAASAGLVAWEARGHAFARIAEEDVVADFATRRVDARLLIDPGPRLTYGPIVVQGARRVREDRVRRIADLRPGQVYDPAELARAAASLRRTGAFTSVAIVGADAPAPGDTLPLQIQVVEQLPRRIGAGAELSSTEGLTFSTFWLHRNLTGRADSLRLEGQITGVGGDAEGPDYSLSYAYNRPATFNPETDLYSTGELAYEDEPGYRARTGALEIGARRIVSDEFQYSYGVGYRYSDVSDAFGRRTFQVLSLPLEAEYDRRRDVLDPVDGYYVQAAARPFYGIEGTDGGLRFTADLRGYEGFGAEERTVLAARVQLGTVIGPGLGDVPPDYLFFSGGGGTVRGQEFESLGVDLDDGRFVGGKSFVGLSAEVRQGVTERIGVVGFADFGLVGEGSDWSGGDSHAGAGLGLRYDTGIGPVRLDVAVPVAGDEDDGGIEFYLGIGQAF